MPVPETAKGHKMHGGDAHTVTHMRRHDYIERPVPGFGTFWDYMCQRHTALHSHVAPPMTGSGSSLGPLLSCQKPMRLCSMTIMTQQDTLKGVWQVQTCSGNSTCAYRGGGKNLFKRRMTGVSSRGASMLYSLHTTECPGRHACAPSPAAHLCDTTMMIDDGTL